MNDELVSEFREALLEMPSDMWEAFVEARDTLARAIVRKDIEEARREADEVLARLVIVYGSKLSREAERETA